MKYHIVESFIGFSVSVWHEEIVKPTFIDKYFRGKKTTVVGRWRLIDQIGMIYRTDYPMSAVSPAVFESFEEAEAFIKRINKKSEVIKEYTYEL